MSQSQIWNLLLAAWTGYLIWFAVVLVRRLRSGVTGSGAWRSRIGALGLDVLALPALLLLAGLDAWDLGPLPVIAAFLLPAIALALWTFAPRYVTSKVLPVGLVVLGLYGLELARTPWSGQPYGLIGSPLLTLLQAWLFLGTGLWLLWRRTDRRRGLARRVLFEPGDRPDGRDRPRWGLLLVPLYLAAVVMMGWSGWFGWAWSAAATIALAVALAVLIVRAPAAAADLALAWLILSGLYGIGLALWWPSSIPLPSSEHYFPYDQVNYGAIWVDGPKSALAAGVEGLALLVLGLWLVPRALDGRTRALLRSAADAELAGRVVRLARTRTDVVNSAAGELRRLERDLHDGPQARLVALGMSLGAAERLMLSSPAAAAAIVAEARESSARVLAELRDIVRGICPPVLADRGLADAVRALALDTPLRTQVNIDLPGRPDPALESACYFAVAEALANAVRHAGASEAQIQIWHAEGTLRISVTDDGTGGADPARGSGLRGMERRLAAFDGIVAVSSPPGGPTTVAIEVPCALSSPKISSC